MVPAGVRPPTVVRLPGRRPCALAAMVLGVALLAAACSSSDAGVASTAGSVPSTAVPAPRNPGTADVLADPAAPPGPDPATTSEPGPVPSVGPSTSVDPVPPTAADPSAAPGPIATTMLALVDPSRPTVSRGTTTSSSRSLPTAVAYPTGSGGPWPLVVFAHGFRLGPPGYTRMVVALAEAGYVVAAPSFPLADEGVAGSLVDRGDLPNQPGDAAYVIDQVLAASADPASPLAGRVDGARIGAVGHSDGADTVLDLGYHPARADGRVRAVVALSPDAVVAAGSGVGASTPLLLEHGDADAVVPYTESTSVFAAVPARRYFLTLLGGGHLEPVTQPTAWTPVLDATIVAFLDRHVAGRDVAEDAITAPGSASSVARIEVAG